VLLLGGKELLPGRLWPGHGHSDLSFVQGRIEPDGVLVHPISPVKSRFNRITPNRIVSECATMKLCAKIRAQ
jgi:hypothetical protein